MINHWKALDLEITDFEYHHDPRSSCGMIPFQTSSLEHVEFIKISVKLTYDASLESSCLGNHRF